MDKLLKKPTYLVSGPTNPKLIGNYNKEFFVIQNETLTCLNCYWSKLCRIECMNELLPEKIIEKFLQIKNQSNSW